MAAVVAVAVPPVEAALAVAVGDGRVVSVGWAVGVADAVPLTVGVGVGVPPPAGAVVLAAGEGVGVQATAGSLVDIFGLCAGPVMIFWVGLTPSGSFHRLEFAAVPPLRPLAPGPAVP
jgi:hypothetical protein